MNVGRVDKAYMQLVSEFPLVPLRAKSEFEEAVKLMKKLAINSRNLTSGEADYLSVLGDLIARYESRIPQPASKLAPQEALAYLLEINGLVQSDIVDCVGHKSNLSAFLGGHRGLSKRAAFRLAEYFKVSPALFLAKD
jgi:HTH-type transcriptional regulator/antitoxin HigA